MTSNQDRNDGYYFFTVICVCYTVHTVSRITRALCGVLEVLQAQFNVATVALLCLGMYAPLLSHNSVERSNTVTFTQQAQVESVFADNHHHADASTLESVPPGAGELSYFLPRRFKYTDTRAYLLSDQGCVAAAGVLPKTHTC